jgi:AcrR family transcriptional regulator
MRDGDCESIGYGSAMATLETPRPRNAEQTKTRILAAAQQAFMEIGYGQAGIRLIANRAGVDSALVQRYFRSKAGLYEAALLDAMVEYPDMDLSHDRFGARLAEKFIEAFLDMRALSMIVLSASDPEAQEINLRVMREHAIKPLADWLGPPDAETRAIRMTMLSTGFMIYTRQIPLMMPGLAVETQTSNWLADQLQSIIDEGRATAS